MVVISLTDCPPALRGGLSRWLLEIDTGVYVGQLSQRVREELWQMVTKHVKTGRAVMVFRARNEQRMDFRIHNAAWEPIDFDGLKLMLRPNTRRQQNKVMQTAPDKQGYSMAAKMRMAKRANKAKAKGSAFPHQFVIIDLETTGLKAKNHEIIELGAIKVRDGEETASFQALVCPVHPLPQAVVDLTGLSDDVLRAQGRPLADALPAFLAFLEDLPVVSHHIAFDLDFLMQACAKTGLSPPNNRRIDTLALAQRIIPDAKNYRLKTLMDHFSLPYPNPHRSLNDCRATLLLLNKLIEIRDDRF